MSGRRRHRSKRSKNVQSSKRLLLVWGGALLAVVIGCVAWVGVRLFLSYSELRQAQSQAKTVVAAIGADPVKAVNSARDELDSLDARLSNARSLTTDPVWRAAEILPFAGENLRSYRLTVDGLASAVGDGLRPALPALSQLGSAVSLTDGKVDVRKVSASASTLAHSASALQDSKKTIVEAGKGSVVGLLADGVEQAGTMVNELSDTVSALSIATKILPPALGADGERHYGLLFNNNAELRTTGGIAGAISELKASDGAISLGRQLVPDDVNPAQGQWLEVSPEERVLFGQRLGGYIQDVNLTPDFVRSSRLTNELWQRANGAKLDGVISIDTVTISKLLEVTGPVTVDGFHLTARNATTVLLNDVYLQIPDRAQQDVFFGEVTRTMFDKVLRGGAPVLGMLKALSAAADEGRISVWFAEDSLQSVITGGTLAGPLAQLSDDGSPVGVFLADGTAGKMSYYLDGSLSAGTTCDVDKGQQITTSVELTSTAPADIASKPWFVTGAGQTDVAVGSIRTMVQFAGTPSLRPESVSVAGETIPLTWKMIDDHPVAIAYIDLTPGASATLTATFAVLPGHAPTIDRIVATPTSTPFAQSVERGRCG